MPEYSIKSGVHSADFIGTDQIITYGFSPEDVERLIEKVLTFMQAGEIFLPVQDEPEALQIEHGNEKLIFHPGAARQLANQAQERAYLLSLVLNQEYQRWASRFVPLAGKMDMRQVIEGVPISFTEFVVPTGETGMLATQRPLQDIADAMQTHNAFVILGEPGAGKTTIMQKIAFDAACDFLRVGQGRIPLFVRLSQQGERDPYSFLKTDWELRTRIPFDQALNEGRILILADGINEIQREKCSERLNGWMLFNQQYRGNNQLIFSGRDKDYDNQLNLPRVLVEPLDESRIHEFLEKHKADGLAELLDDPVSRLGEMAQNPLNLFVLVMVYLGSGRNLQVLANRGRLFQSFTLSLLNHEQLWHPDVLSLDAKVSLFSGLAYEMQKQGSGTTLGIEVARNLLPKEVTVMGEQVQIDPNAVFRFGRGASIIDPSTIPDVRFYHHSLQEYFAARELLRRFNLGEDLSVYWKTPRTKKEMPPEEVGEWDPLPEPPTTGWEMTTILACGLSNNPAKLIEAIRVHNPVLAGCCLDEAGLSHLSLGDETVVESKVRSDLLADIYNSAIHLRARLHAGFVLGRIGDPRFEAQEINGVKIILPQMVRIPADSYLVGAEKGDINSFENEYPQFTVNLPSYSIGKWSVTNAEFACFINSGGYENEIYWDSELAIRWLKGDEVGGGQIKSWLEIWELLQTLDNIRDVLEKNRGFTPDQIDSYVYIAKLNEDDIKTELRKSLLPKSRNLPAYWKDHERNNPSQPVVGVTWFEAQAYCVWLSKNSGKEYRLPTEIEWEAAAHGISAHSLFTSVRKYPWGNEWSAEKTNSIEGRVFKPSPVGVYAVEGAVGPFGAEDQAGNVYDWTSSLYLPYPYEAKRSEQKESDAERAIRGGSWVNNRRGIRCTDRGRLSPGFFNFNVGFRLVSPNPDI